MNIKHISSYLKTDLSYIIKGSATMVTGQSLVSLIAFGASITFANLLPKETYGIYQYILTIAEFITIFSLTGLTQSVVRSVARGHEGTLTDAYRRGMLWSIPAVLTGCGISVFQFWNDNVILGYCLLLAAVGGPLIANAKLYQSFLIGKKLFPRSASYAVIGNSIPTLAIVVSLFVTDNLLVLTMVYFSAHSIVHILLHRHVQKLATNTATDPETIPYAVHLSAQNIIMRTAAEIDKILLFHFAGAIALAEYFFAITVPRQFQHFFKSAKMIVLPKVSTQSFGELKKTLPKKIGILYVFIIPITIGYWFVAPFLFQWFFPAYKNVVIFSQIYGLIFLFLPLTIFQDAIIGHAKQHILYKTNIVSAVVKIGTTVLLVPTFGISGVLTSLLLSQAFSSLQIMYYFFRESTKTLS